MRTSLAPKYTWTDSRLTEAVVASACWRDVMRALGVSTNPESVIRRIKADVSRLGLDVSHFKGSRTWNDSQLRRAVAGALSWDDVFASMGLRTPTKATSPRPGPPRDAHRTIGGPRWMATSTEAAVYDLLVHSGAEIHRVQVKTTTTGAAAGQVVVSHRPYSAGNLGPRMPYDPKAIDYFFIVDGDYNIYLIPSRVIAGRVGLVLRTYKSYIVGNAAGSLGAMGEAGQTEAVREPA